MKQPLSNFPKGFYLTLISSKDRQAFMDDQLRLYGINTLEPLISPRFKAAQDIVTGKYVYQLDDGTKGCIVSHLKALKICLERYTDPYFFICEDDISFETSQYWDKTWTDIISSLPPDWDVVQLHCIRSEFTEVSLRPRLWDDWSVGAYLVKREYAQRLVDHYIKDGVFHLELPYNDVMPLAENIIYTGLGNAYCYPLFVENVSLLSTFKESYEADASKALDFENGHKVYHRYARDYVFNWWKDKTMTLLDKFVKNPEDAETNFNLAYWYEERGQTAAAISYYLRSAERSDNPELSYEAMLRVASCFDKQGGRNNSVRGAYETAFTICPKRPEAYFLMSQYLELTGDRYHSYNIATIGLSVADFTLSPLRTDVGYRGKHGILFEQAVSAWSRGLCEQSRKMFHLLADDPDLDYSYQQLVQRNLVTLGISNRDPYPLYDKSKYSKLRVKFKDSDLIDRNYSQAYQDMFILTMLNGKREGKYLEIGSGHPFNASNTVLLEKLFGWKGASLEIQTSLVEEFRAHRSNPVYQQDAIQLNYHKFLKDLNLGTDFDYLQLDCEPPKNTFEILLGIPFEKYRFAVITYEHDHFQDVSKTYRDKSRRYLTLQGYRLIANDIASNEYASFEDWWVHPDLVDPQIVNQMLSVKEEVQKAEKYMLSI